MEPYTRFAIYFAPEPGPFADFCASWLGWDAAQGVTRAHPALPGLPHPVEAITETPRKYGFHGTIKPPFALTGTRAALEADFAALATRLAPVRLDGLRLARLGDFLALVPKGDSDSLVALAAEVVRGLDGHRAPLSAAQLARRRAAGLSARQEALLARWGYPYVMEEFRFHLTLSGPLAAGTAAAVEAALAPHLIPLLPRPFEVGSLCLFGEGTDGLFHLLQRQTLSG